MMAGEGGEGVSVGRGPAGMAEGGPGPGASQRRDEAEDVAFSLVRETDDPLALRASIGGRRDVGWYMIYRGEPRAVLAMLRTVLRLAEGELAKGTQQPRGPQG